MWMHLLYIMGVIILWELLRVTWQLIYIYIQFKLDEIDFNLEGR